MAVYTSKYFYLFLYIYSLQMERLLEWLYRFTGVETTYGKNIIINLESVYEFYLLIFSSKAVMTYSLIYFDQR